MAVSDDLSFNSSFNYLWVSQSRLKDWQTRISVFATVLRISLIYKTNSLNIIIIFFILLEALKLFRKICDLFKMKFMFKSPVQGLPLRRYGFIFGLCLQVKVKTLFSDFLFNRILTSFQTHQIRLTKKKDPCKVGIPYNDNTNEAF